MQNVVCCDLPSLDRTMPESVISQENNSPLTLYTEFHNVYFFLDINSPQCMHNHLSPNIPKYKSRGKMHFHEK